MKLEDICVCYAPIAFKRKMRRSSASHYLLQCYCLHSLSIPACSIILSTIFSSRFVLVLASFASNSHFSPFFVLALKLMLWPKNGGNNSNNKKINQQRLCSSAHSFLILSMWWFSFLSLSMRPLIHNGIYWWHCSCVCACQRQYTLCENDSS